MSASTSTTHASLNKEKHVRYWLRCLKTFLPSVYISNEAQRMSLGFFILSALDLLGALHTRITASERTEYADWILRCQHPDGGFRGFTGTMTGNENTNEWDVANLAATYFACAALVVLGEGMERVRRKECLEWVKSLQRANGSFGEGIGKGGVVEGAEDMRFCYLAAVTRWFLRRGEDMDEVEDINVEGLVEWIKASVTYEGGIAQAPLHEAHAGFTYNGVGALMLLGMLPRHTDKSKNEGTMSAEFVENVTKWLVSRQTLMLHEEDELSMADDEPPDMTPKFFPPTFHVQGAFPVSVADAILQNASIEISTHDLQWAGFNGRCNKVADTCYAFWVGGTLGMLKREHIQDFNAIRYYLLDKTQHMVGGFGKLPGDGPDILHSYLGLATLATIHDPDLKSIDPTLCISLSARENLVKIFGSKQVRGNRHSSSIAHSVH
ncbi:MAG: Geranylgeranyl transferase type-1 subunit beta [Alectoria sarmentosa]|nr:MAG: Geranylgeranyl transferase type-1 subunit beta [Alectoria sarmentosa]